MVIQEEEQGQPSGDYCRGEGAGADGPGGAQRYDRDGRPREAGHQQQRPGDEEPEEGQDSEVQRGE